MSASMRGQYNSVPPTIPEGSFEFAQIDENGNLRVAVVSGGGGSGGDASASNQSTQITLETAIKTAVESIDSKVPADPATDTSILLVIDALAPLLQEGGTVTETNSSDILTAVELLGAKTPGPSTEHRNITSIPMGGVDLRTLVSGKKCIALEGYALSAYGLIEYSLFDDLDTNTILRTFGSNYLLQGVAFGKVLDTSDPAILPFRAYFA